jgi:hypothetical protein
MFNKPTMTDAECSPWPPVLWFTPEVQSGIKAAADLAFGPESSSSDLEVPAHDFLSEDDFIIE